MLPVNGLAKESWKKGTKKISRCARNDSVGNGYPLYRIKCALGKCSSCITISRYVHHTKNVWETRSSRIVIPSGVEGSFSLAVRGRVSDSEKRETPYREKVGAVLPVNGLAKEEGKRGRKRFLAALEMIV